MSFDPIFLCEWVSECINALDVVRYHQSLHIYLGFRIFWFLFLRVGATATVAKAKIYCWWWSNRNTGYISLNSTGHLFLFISIFDYDYYCPIFNQKILLWFLFFKFSINLQFYLKISFFVLLLLLPFSFFFLDPISIKNQTVCISKYQFHFIAH